MSNAIFPDESIARFAKSLSGKVGAVCDMELAPIPTLDDWMEFQQPYRFSFGDLPSITCDADSLGFSRNEPSLPYALEIKYCDDRQIKAIATLRNVVALNIKYGSLTGLGIKQIAAVPSIKYLNLEGCDTLDSEFGVLAMMPMLNSLSLKDTSITDTGVELLCRSRSLRHISLAGTQITDASLQALASMKSLESISLYGTSVSDPGIDYLSKSSSLKSLELTSTKITSEGIASLAAIPNLETIGLYEITDGDLEAISRCKKLKSLKCQGFKYVTDEGLASISKIESLQKFSLSYSEITDRGIALLGSLRQLRELRLTDCKITDEALKIIGKLTDLESLDLSRTNCTDGGFESLGNLKNLSSLTFRLNEGDGAGFRYLAALGNLQELIIALKHPITADIAAQFTHLHALKRLDINGVVRDDAFEPISQMQSLQFLSISTNSATSVGYRHLESMTNLRELLLCNGSLSDADLPYLYKLKKLQKIRFVFSEVSEKGLNKLAKAMPWCDTFPIRPTKIDKLVDFLRSMLRRILSVGRG